MKQIQLFLIRLAFLIPVTITTIALSAGLFFWYQPIATHFPTWGEKGTGIGALWAILAVLYLVIGDIFKKTTLKEEKIKPQIVIDGKKETRIPNISTEVIFSIINKGTMPIQSNTLKYVLIIPKGLFYGNLHGSVDNHYGASVLQHTSATEIRGKVSLVVNPESQPQKLVSCFIKMGSHKKQTIQYYFLDENNTYYPKLKFDKEYGLPIGNFGKVMIKTK